MKRKKEKPEVKLDISKNFQPVTPGFKRSSLEALRDVRGVDKIVMNGVLETLAGKDRVAAMRTIQKALKTGGMASCIVSHWSTAGASMSPFSCWPPLSPESFGFFSAEIRKRSDYKDPRLEDIDFEVGWDELYPDDWKSRADIVRSFAAKHYTNVLQGLSVTLTKKGK